jgi:hypothetical protein
MRRSGPICGKDIQGFYISEEDQKLFSETLSYVLKTVGLHRKSKGHLNRIRQMKDMMNNKQENQEKEIKVKNA